MTRDPADPLEPDDRFTARLDEWAPELQRLEGQMYAAHDSLELLDRLPRLEHVTIYELSDSCLDVPVRFSHVTSLSLLQTREISTVVQRFCCVLPLRRLELQHWAMESPGLEPEPLTSQA